MQHLRRFLAFNLFFQMSFVPCPIGVIVSKFMCGPRSIELKLTNNNGEKSIVGRRQIPIEPGIFMEPSRRGGVA